MPCNREEALLRTAHLLQSKELEEVKVEVEAEVLVEAVKAEVVEAVEAVVPPGSANDYAGAVKKCQVLHKIAPCIHHTLPTVNSLPLFQDTR